MLTVDVQVWEVAPPRSDRHALSELSRFGNTTDISKSINGTRIELGIATKALLMLW